MTLDSSQNLARHPMEAPANFITPSQFCVEAERETAGLTSTKMAGQETVSREFTSVLSFLRLLTATANQVNIKHTSLTPNSSEL